MSMLCIYENAERQGVHAICVRQLETLNSTAFFFASEFNENLDLTFNLTS